MESERPSAFRRVRSRIESQDALQQQRTLKKAKHMGMNLYPLLLTKKPAYGTFSGNTGAI